MWIWDQSSGVLTRNGKHVANGYSGRDWGKNNPDAQEARSIGPIPRGDWRITKVVQRHAKLGPYVIHLEPEPGTDTRGRSAFRIHGDSIRNPGTASHGCIIVGRAVRELIWNSGDHLLRVVE